MRFKDYLKEEEEKISKIIELRIELKDAESDEAKIAIQKKIDALIASGEDGDDAKDAKKDKEKADLKDKLKDKDKAKDKVKDDEKKSDKKDSEEEDTFKSEFKGKKVKGKKK